MSIALKLLNQLWKTTNEIHDLYATQGTLPMISEHLIQTQIQLALSKHHCTVFRANVGKFKTQDGRWVSTGLPNGHPDLYFFRWLDGRVGYIEVKNKKGRLRPDQMRFHEMLASHHIIHCCARSVSDALKTVDNGYVGYGYPDWNGEKI